MIYSQEKKLSYKFIVIIYLTMLTTGIGYLTLPRFAVQLGLFTTLLVVLLAGLAQMISNFLLARLYNYHQITSYPGIVYEITSKQAQSKFLYKLTLATLSLRQFGAIFLTIFFRQINLYNEILTKFIITIIAFLLSLINIKRTKYFSLLGFISALTFLIALGIQKQTIYNDEQFISKRTGKAFDIPDKKNLWSLLSLYGNAFYAFHIQDVFVNILQMLEGESTYSTISCALRSTYFPILICILTIYIGFTSFFQDTQFLIFDVVNGTQQIYNKSWIFYIIRIGIALNLMVALFTRIKSACQAYFLWKRPHMKNLDTQLLININSKHKVIWFLFSIFIRSSNICQFINIATCLFGPFYTIYLPCELTLLQKKQLGIQNNKCQQYLIRFYQLTFIMLLLGCWVYSIYQLFQDIFKIKKFF